MTLLLSLLVTLAASADTGKPQRPYFQINVVDEQTGRGVPLVELQTVNHIVHYTDSNGIVAFHEPGLMGREVFFHIRSHGYEFPADGFGMRGRVLRVTRDGEARLEIKRINIAERLYRLTGGGIYRDSVLTNHPVPIREPVLNGDVLGQDSIQTAIYQGKIYWCWGDTNWPRYPLGNFHMSGATSSLPPDGGLDPDVGVDLEYFVRENGFSKEMAPHPEPGPVWQDAFVTLADEAGGERMYAAYARVTPAMKAVERGFMLYNDQKEIFEKILEFDLDAPIQPHGHPFTHVEDGVEYIWFPNPFPLVRVRANIESYLDISRYEAWTPLKEGSTLETPAIDRDPSGAIRYAWRRNTPALDQKHQNELIKSGLMKTEEAWIHLQDVDTGKPVIAHAGSVYCNEYRRRWITIRCEQFGTSMLGETWYAEADTPLGPWVYARKVVTHDKYDFYNPKHHPFFDKDDGRVIYFEGTYVNTFSGNPDKTPRYDYNQIMYKLDLADERLALPVPVYRLTEASWPDRFATGGNLPPNHGLHRIAFFALDRPTKNAVPVYQTKSKTERWMLSTRLLPEAAEEYVRPAFYALSNDHANTFATTVPLYEFVAEDGDKRAYSTDSEWSMSGFRKSDQPVCRVWPNPMALALSPR